MNGTTQPLQRPAPAHSVMLSQAMRALVFVSLVGLVGCVHRQHYVLPKIAQIPEVPIDLIPVPEANPPMMVELPEDVEEVDPPDLPSTSATFPVRRRRTPATAPAAVIPPAAQPESPAPAAAEPTVLGIGELSAGGDRSPKTQQQTKDLIASIQHRIAVLPARIAAQQKVQLRQVRYFVKQAQQALESGDAEGAKTLATKASLLMDDIEKK